jgi:hypothetical protein
MNLHKEKNTRHEVIHTYEIGLSQFFIKNNIKLHSIFNSKNYIKGNKANATIFFAKELICNDFPVIKKKTIFNSFLPDELQHIKNCGYDFNINWNSLIEERGYKILEILN